MPATYRSSSTTAVTDAFTTSVTLPVPPGAAAGDIAVVGLVRWESSNPAVTMPAGFALKGQAVNGNEKLAFFWKRLTGADVGVYTFSWTGQQYCGAQCVMVSGGLAAGDPIGANFNTANGSAAATPPTSVSPAYAPFLVHFTSNEDSVTHLPPTAPAAFTEVQDSGYLATSYLSSGSTGLHSVSGGSSSIASLKCAALIAVQSDGGAPVTSDALKRDKQMRLGALLQM